MKGLTTGILVLMATLAGCGDKGATTATLSPEKAPAEEVKANPAPVPVEPTPSVIPAGARLAVRTTNTLSTANVKPGDSFSATLAEPLRIGDRVVAPRGATVEGRITEADPGGRVKGKATLAVQLVELRAGGRSVRISTNTIRREARATKGKDAAKIGIGSGIGAAIGAIAGGGKGAGIGAAAGGAAGTGLVLGTHGDPAVIASESLLTFQLKSPLTIP